MDEKKDNEQKYLEVLNDTLAEIKNKDKRLIAAEIVAIANLVTIEHGEGDMAQVVFSEIMRVLYL